MSKPRHIAVDDFGRIWEVTDMFDRHANETLDPAIADTCVVLWGESARPASVHDIPIYTVH